MSVVLHTGDCIEVMRGILDNSVDSVVTDPPYELGFMGKKWDSTGIANNPLMWAEALRVLKPGGHLLSFGGSRTYHRMACAIEDAGFEIRDQIQWVYGSGFPKSLNCGNGFGTALKPAHEPICMARKPFTGTVAANLLLHGTGAINIDECRVGENAGWSYPNGRGGEGCFGRESLGTNLDTPMAATQGRFPANLIHDGSPGVLSAFPNAPGQIAESIEDGAEEGNSVFGAMKRGGPNHKPRNETDKSASRFFYCAKASKSDREDGLDDFDGFSAVEVVGRALDSNGVQNPRAGSGRGAGVPIYKCRLCDLNLGGGRAATVCPKAENQKHEREQIGVGEARKNTHPTVKPTELMRYLCRLITPPGGTVLDMFCGSGSTGRGAVMEGFSFIGIDLDYTEIARARIQAVTL